MKKFFYDELRNANLKSSKQRLCKRFQCGKVDTKNDSYIRSTVGRYSLRNRRSKMLIDFCSQKTT